MILCLLASVFIGAAGLARADLTKDVNGAILAGLRDDTTRTNHEKLYVYRCESIAKSIGFSDNPTGKATKFSCDEAGVGIALYAGKDLGKHPPEKVGEYFVDMLAKEGLKAKVFIKHDHEHGSSMAFYINGASWEDDPLRPSKAVEQLDALASESKLILLTDGRIDKWPERVDTE